MSILTEGDNGTLFEVDLIDDVGAVNLTTTLSITAHFVRPDGTTFDKALTVTDAAAGACAATLTREDLTVRGGYAFQVTAVFDDGKEFSGGTKKLYVGSKL